MYLFSLSGDVLREDRFHILCWKKMTTVAQISAGTQGVVLLDFSEHMDHSTTRHNKKQRFTIDCAVFPQMGQLMNSGQMNRVWKAECGKQRKIIFNKKGFLKIFI